MYEIKSVAKPAPGNEALESLAAESRRTRAGSSGTAGDEISRASTHLLVHGKKAGRVERAEAASGLETVIGSDDRTRILETDLAPWRMICSLRMSGPGGGGAIGTGWFVGPRTIVTAGHCVFSKHFFGGWASRIDVTPGRNGSEAPFGHVRSLRFSSVNAWVENEDPDFDYACIHLDESLGDQLGWFGVGALPSDELAEHMVNISGYPGDRGQGREQFFHANRILRVTPRRIFYDVDTFGGQSGAPVWIQRDAADAPLAVGIHAYGVGGSTNLVANSAPRIIPEVLQLIEGWVEESFQSS